MSDKVISAQNVAKTYETKQPHEGAFGFIKDLISPQYVYQDALKSVSLELFEGECLGYLGPNGAGKSTLIKILCGLQFAGSGTVNVLDYDPFRKDREFLKKIGVVLGHKSSLWWDLPVSRSFETTKALYGIDNATFERNLKELGEAFELSDVLHKPARVLSLGERVKSEVIMNLLHNPKVLFLDEPTVGLDVGSKFHLRNLLNKRKSETGLAIILTSHDMGDVEACCDRVIYAEKGSVIFEGSSDDIKSYMGKERVISISSQTHFSSVQNAFLSQLLETSPSYSVVSRSSRKIEISTYDKSHLPLLEQIDQTINNADVGIRMLSLEEVIVKRQNMNKIYVTTRGN